MDNITSEVSKKVKSAIKAKLTELGAYVDDELPDYIMILVGNKKTKDQMDDDLSLFLGHNTERFTSWLHAVLQKLNAASMLQAPKPPKEKVEEEKRIEQAPENIEQAPDKKKHKKKKDKSEKKKEKKEKKKKKDKDREKDKSEKSLLKAQRKKEKEAKLLAASNSSSNNILKTSKLEGSVKATDSGDKTPLEEKSNINKSIVANEKESLNTEENSIIVVKKKVENNEEDDQLAQDVVDLRPNAADLTLDLEEEAPLKRRKTELHLASNATSKPSNIIIHVKNDTVNEQSVESSSPLRTLEPCTGSPKTSVHDRLGPAASAASKRIINLREESSFPPKSSSEDGTLPKSASNVTSSALKSSIVVPKSSLDVKPSKKLEARVRPLVSSRIVKAEEEEKIAVPLTRMVSTVVAVQKRPHSSDESDDENQPATKKLTGIASKIEVTPRPKRSTAGQANSALIMRAMADAHKSVNKPMKRVLEDKEEQSPKKELFTRSYQERKGQRLGPAIEGKKGVKQYAITVPNELLSEKVKSGIRRDNANGEDVRLEKEYMQELEPHEKNDMEGLVEEGPEKPPHMRSQAMKRKLLLQGSDENLVSTRFIVTMDGFGNDNGDLRARLINSRPPVRPPSVEEEEYIEEVEEWEEEVEEMEVPNLENAGKVAPAGAVTYGAKLKLVKDPVTQVAKKDERCRFWPACKEGESCKYLHPSKPCSTFPKCRFGDKCLFIHPKCKFDAACAKLDCPFTHTVARHLTGSVPGVPVKMKFAAPHISKIKCRYYPKCVDMNCPYMHPKQLCRYGKVCQTSGCPFIHPDVTMGSLLKWTAPKASPTTVMLTKAVIDNDTLTTASLTKKLNITSAVSSNPMSNVASALGNRAPMDIESTTENSNALESNKPLVALSSS